MLTRGQKERKRQRVALVFKGFPEEILFEILAKLPVKCLLRLRCICKYWKNLISSSDFINAHVRGSRHDDCLLVQTKDKKFVSLLRADTLAMFSKIELPTDPSAFYSCHIVGSCNGVVCIHEDRGKTYLWNPSIRKSVRLPLIEYAHRLGFGFHLEGNDYKVAKFMSRGNGIVEVMVYSSRLESWRRIDAVPPTCISNIEEQCVCVNGVVYWLMQQRSPHCNSILSYDLGREVFQTMSVPDSLFRVTGNTGPWYFPISIRVFENSLSLFHERQDETDRHCDIWVLEMGSWNLVRTILLPARGTIAWPLGFASSNGPIYIELSSQKFQSRRLVLYDPETQRVKDDRIKLNTSSGRYLDYFRESLALFN